MKFPGFVGPTYNLPQVAVDCQRCVNLFPEIIESGNGKEGATIYYKSTPGYNELFEVGEGPIRMVLVDDPKKDVYNPDNRLFIASGSEMYKAVWNGTTWVPTKLGDLETSTGPVSGVTMQGDLGSGVFVDGVQNYVYHRYNTGDGLIEENFGIFADQGYLGALGATHVIWIDGFFIMNMKDTEQFYVSGWNSLNIDPLSYASSEGDPDSIVAMIANNRDLWLFNERSTEVWSNTGNADFPFERIQGGFIEKGCVAPWSVAKGEGAVFWLGRDANGEGIVYAATGLVPQRISTHAVESAISSYANIKSATGYTYQKDGHFFYVLNFAEGTWVYDLSTKMWHERARTEDGELGRHRADFCAYHPSRNLHILGDFETGKIYAFDSNTYTEAGEVLTRMRIAPHMNAGMKRVFHKRFQLDMVTGVGLDGDGQGSDPQVMLSWSNDGGYTWPSELWASAGKKIGGIGDFKKRVFWNRLGSSYDRVYKIKVTDPVPVTIIGADIDVEVGAS